MTERSTQCRESSARPGAWCMPTTCPSVLETLIFLLDANTPNNVKWELEYDHERMKFQNNEGLYIKKIETSMESVSETLLCKASVFFALIVSRDTWKLWIPKEFSVLPVGINFTVYSILLDFQGNTKMACVWLLGTQSQSISSYPDSCIGIYIQL